MTLTHKPLVPALAITLLALIAGYTKPVQTAELRPAAAVSIDAPATMLEAALDRLASTPEARQLVAEARTLMARLEEAWHLLRDGGCEDED